MKEFLSPWVPILVFIAVWFFIMRRGGWAKHYENHMQRCEKHMERVESHLERIVSLLEEQRGS